MFLRQVAGHDRPAIIFDSAEAILIDMGATHYIDHVVVKDHGARRPAGHSYTITVVPKQYLTHAPLLSSADLSEYIIQAKRGPKFDWIYELDCNKSVSSDEGRPSQFRLEVVP